MSWDVGICKTKWQLRSFSAIRTQGFRGLSACWLIRLELSVWTSSGLAFSKSYDCYSGDHFWKACFSLTSNFETEGPCNFQMIVIGYDFGKVGVTKLP